MVPSIRHTPDARILGHVGTNTRAIAGVIDQGVGATMVAHTIPNKTERDNCTSIQKMKNLAAALREDAAADDDGSVASKTRSNKGSKTDDADHGDDNASTTSKKKNKKKGSKTSKPDKHVMFAVFKPATFLHGERELLFSYFSGRDFCLFSLRIASFFALL